MLSFSLFPFLVDKTFSELSAGAVYIPAHLSSDSNIYTAFFKLVFKRLYGLAAGLDVFSLFYRIDRYQIDMAVLVFNQTDQSLSFIQVIVDSLNRLYSNVSLRPVFSK